MAGVPPDVSLICTREFDPEVPSENASARSQTQLLVAAVLAHAFAFCLAGMVFL